MAVAARWRRGALLARTLTVVVVLMARVNGRQANDGIPNRHHSEDAPSVFMNDRNVTSRFEHLYRSGLHAAPLAIAEAELPHEINATLSAHALAWNDLGGTLQRLLLWDTGYVATSSQSALVRVYVECGLTMDEIVIPRDEFQAQGCSARQCNKTLTSVAGPCTTVRAKCAINGLDSQSSAQVMSWSEETPNDDIPRPTIFRLANQSYAIHMDATGFDANSERCPTQLRLAIPCTHVHSDTAEWCAPKPCDLVASLLMTLRSSTTTVVQGESAGSDTNLILPILWLSVMCIAGIASVAFVMSQRHVDAVKQRVDGAVNTKQLDAPATTMTSETELNFVSIRSNQGTLADSIVQTTRSLGALSTIHGSSSSLMDLLNVSPVLLAFQNDPLVVKKRISMADIEFTRRLCHGASGDVFVGRVHGRRVAVKQLLQLKRRELDDIECFAREIQLTATLDHPNIVKLIGVAWNTFQDLALVLEYRSGGDLLNAIRKRGARWSWNAEKLQVAIGVAKAMVYLHSRRHPLVHRDIKSRNILIDAATIEPALCDFGSSRSVSALDLLSTDPAGTILWSAPEVICSQTYTVKADIFSFGVVLAELDTCSLPYTEERDSEGRTIQAIRIAHMVVENKVKPQLTEHCPRFIRELVIQCVKHKPESRPTAEEVLTKLTEAANDCAALWKSKSVGMESL